MWGTETGSKETISLKTNVSKMVYTTERWASCWISCFLSPPGPTTRLHFPAFLGIRCSYVTPFWTTGWGQKWCVHFRTHRPSHSPSSILSPFSCSVEKMLKTKKGKTPWKEQSVTGPVPQPAGPLHHHPLTLPRQRPGNRLVLFTPTEVALAVSLSYTI